MLTTVILLRQNQLNLFIYIYDAEDIDSIPKVSVLGVGCGAPTKLAKIKEGETIVDLGSGTGIDVLLAANQVVTLFMYSYQYDHHIRNYLVYSLFT